MHVEGVVVCTTAVVLRAPILGGQGKRMPRMQMTLVTARPGGEACQVLLSQFKGVPHPLKAFTKSEITSKQQAIPLSSS